MQVGRHFIAIVAFALVVLSIPAAAQRYCNVPCSHPAHPYDVAPCTHPCYSPYGPVPCHPAGDAYPCVHPLHAYDVVFCEH